MILVLIEHADNKVKKAGLEALTIAKQLAVKTSSEVGAIVIGSIEDPESLGKYGADQCFLIDHPNLQQFDSSNYTEVVAQIAKQHGADIVILSHTSKGKALVGRLAIKLESDVLSGVSQFVGIEEGALLLKKPVFAGKGIASFKLNAKKAVFTLLGNAVQPQTFDGSCTVITREVSVAPPREKVVKVDRATGEVPLPEAEIVVSAGRGMKGPENWGIIEDLAKELGATTACSRPVADMDWRPHHEHVGQTGIAISPNLYIAAGISGAIQHLAGVNSSKNIVVINKDPEAPFFKAADYGVVGDLFEVVPRLTEAIRKFKNNQ